MSNLTTREREKKEERIFHNFLGNMGFCFGMGWGAALVAFGASTGGVGITAGILLVLYIFLAAFQMWRLYRR